MTKNTQTEHIEESVRRLIGGTSVTNDNGETEYYAFEIPARHAHRFHTNLAYLEAMTGYKVAFENNEIKLKHNETTINPDNMEEEMRQILTKSQMILNISSVVPWPKQELFTTHPQIIESALYTGYQEASEKFAQKLAYNKESIEMLTGCTVVAENENIMLTKDNQPIDLSSLSESAMKHLEEFVSSAQQLNHLRENDQLSLESDMITQIKSYAVRDARNDISKDTYKSLVYNQVYLETKEDCDVRQIDGAFKLFKGETEIDPTTFDADSQEKLATLVSSAAQINDYVAREKFYITPEQQAAITAEESARAKADAQQVKEETPKTREYNIHKYKAHVYEHARSRLEERRFLDGDKIAGVRFNKKAREQALSNLRHLEELGLLPKGVNEQGEVISNAEIYLYKMAQAGKLYGTDTTIIIRDENGKRSRKEAVEALNGNHRTTIQTLTGTDITQLNNDEQTALVNSVLGIENAIDTYGRAIKEVPNTRRNKSYKANASAGYEQSVVSVTVPAEKPAKEEPTAETPAKDETTATTEARNLQSTLKVAETEAHTARKEEPAKGMQSLSGFDKATDAEETTVSSQQRSGSEKA